MKLPDFHAPSAKWDEFRRFHNRPSRIFAHFESGEAILGEGCAGPDWRRRIMGTDLRILATTESDCPLFVLDKNAVDYERVVGVLRENRHDKIADGAPIPKSWLTQLGLIVLLLDETTRRAVCIGGFGFRTWHRAWEHAPRWVDPPTGYHRNVSAYLPGNDRPAIACSVTLAVPLRQPKDVQARLDQLRAECHGVADFLEWDTARWAPDWYKLGNRWDYRYLYQRPRPWHRGPVPAVSDLRNEEIFQLAKYGWGKESARVPIESLTAI